LKKSIYISSHQKSANSLVFSIGFMHHLKKLFHKVGFFRPISINHNNIYLMNQYFNIKEDINKCYGVDEKIASKLISDSKIDELSDLILTKYTEYKKNYDFVLLQGFNYSSLNFPISNDFNIDLAKNLESVFVCVLNGNNKDISDISKMLTLEQDYIKKSKVSHLYTIASRIKKEHIQKLKDNARDDNILISRECKKINYLSINKIQKDLECKVLFGEKYILEQYINRKIIADADINNVISNIKKNDLIIVSKSNTSAIFSLLYSQNSKDISKIGAILLVGRMKISPKTIDLLNGINNISTIVLSCDLNTYKAVNKLESLEPKLTKGEDTKIQYAIELTQETVTLDDLKNKLNAKYEDIMTPFMFEHFIFEKAKANKQTIVLPESQDERILKASHTLQSKNLVNIILLGLEDDIINKATTLGLDLSKTTIINPKTSELKKPMSKKLYELRKHKNITKDMADDLIDDYTYFATMMVQMGYADGMVSGAIHTTANTIRPALQIIKTKQNIDIVSSIFFMCMDTKVLIFGDCAINQNPDALELAQIAISSAKSALDFGFEPKVALMSYSSGSSGQGKDVEKVIQATKIIKDTTNILAEGPLQYDSAIDKKVGALKMPNSKIAGVANVLIFPDLNTGNNTYKAVQRSSNALAIGPILQGLNKPVNDLSRGCSEADIINTVVITALQAIGDKK